MNRTFTTLIHPRVTLAGNELPLIATVRFTYVPAYPGRGPRYADGGLPPEPESVEDAEVVELMTDDEHRRLLDRPQWLCDWIVENVDESELLEAVDLGPDPDEMRDRMRDNAMDRREHDRIYGADE